VSPTTQLKAWHDTDILHAVLKDAWAFRVVATQYC